MSEWSTRLASARTCGTSFRSSSLRDQRGGSPCSAKRRRSGGSVGSSTTTAPLYSVSEQIALLRAGHRGFDAFWSPHYNVPIAARAPLVVTVHDVIHLARPEFTRQFAKHAYARMMFERVRRRAAAIVTVSEFTKQEFLRLVG